MKSRGEPVTIDASVKRARAVLRRARALLPFRDLAGTDVCLVLGSGRSGTTWLAEQLALNCDGRIIFEPMHPVANRQRPWMENQKYLRAGDEAPAWREVIDPIVDGSARSVWADRYNHRLSYRYRIVKLIRANLMLGWLAHHYPHAPLALVVRDPVEVALSQRRGGWPIELDRFRRQPTLVEDYPIIVSELLARASTPFELNVAHWAVQNRVALDQLQAARLAGAKVAAFKYGDLRGNPERFREFAAFCGVTVKDAALSELDRPSRVARSATDGGSGESKSPVSDSEREYARLVISAFDLSEYATGST